MKNKQATHGPHYFIQGRYRVIESLGKGASGAVYLVEDESPPQKHFALKEVTHLVREERADFTYDAAALQRLDHPALPRIHQLLQNDSRDGFCLLMDYCQGSNLEVMRQLMPGKRFSLQAAMTLMSPIMDAVSYLHRQHPHLIHGDIKPSNIIAPVAGTSSASKLVDFGGVISFARGDSTQASTSPFRAPEQFNGKTSRRSDIYALGAVFYTLLTGTVPATALDRLARLEAGEPDPLLQIRRFIPSAPIIVDAIERAMSLSRHSRFDSAEQFRKALWQVMHIEHVLPLLPNLKVAAPERAQKESNNGSDPVTPEETVAASPAEAASLGETTSVELPPAPALPGEGMPVPRHKQRHTSTKHPAIANYTGGTVIRKKRRRKPRVLLPAMLVLLLVSVTGLGVVLSLYQTYSAQYQSAVTQAHDGVSNLQTGLSLLQTWSKNPYNALQVTRAQQRFVSASTDFAQLNAELQSVPGAARLMPGNTSRLSAALHLVPIALEVSSAGITACHVLNLIVSRFHQPFDVGSGLTLADIGAIDKGFRQIEADINRVKGQINALSPQDLQVDPGAGKVVAAFHRYLPSLEALLRQTDQLLPVLPALLGVPNPAYYIVEILDNSNLRPGGGIIKDYGYVTFIGGRLSSAHIDDANLLDSRFQATGNSLPLPSVYRWFDPGSQGWGLRDSNLDADFPTDARYAEQNFKSEGGRVAPLGVIAITPALMEKALKISGPIAIPELHVTVTADNLTALIRYYQVGPGSHAHPGGVLLSPDQPAHASRYFTDLLAQRYLARIHRLPAATLVVPEFVQMFTTALRTKDLQVYFNSPAAEGLLQLAHVDAAIPAAPGDTFFVVDANTANNNANQFITSTMDDRVAIDGSGRVSHVTTIRYAWLTSGDVNGPPLYQDYVRIYVPPGSTLRSQQGWQPAGISTAFGHQVWAGSFTLAYGQSRILTFSWVEKGMVKKDAAGWHYHYLIARQAGATRTLNARFTIPACAARIQTSGGHLSRNGQVMMLTQPITEDANLGITYTC